MSDMLSVASGFQYSVNIGYDLNHDDKLQNFIPTKSSLDLLQEILESASDSSTERARVLVGAYGKGKSHIVLTILSILMRKDRELFIKLNEKIDKNSELERLIENYYDSGRKLLPVIINGSSTSMQQAFLIALQKALSENEMMSVMPDTNFHAAINAIKRWKSEFPSTFKQFKKEIGQPAAKFIESLEKYDVDSYSLFERIYPKLTSGSVFNPFLGFDIAELYESVVKCIRPIGYSGLFVVYDEFSKYLEANIKEASVSDTKMLQDFAEKCNRSGSNQMHLLLISHKEISNYIDKLPKQKVDGWRGVSERFKHIHLNNNFTQTYEIISSVIVKSPRRWSSFKKNYKESFEALVNRYESHAIFSDMTSEESKRTIYNCYPLHPVSTFILPRLSERVAQNERTLFTFLSAKGTSTLPSFLNDYQDNCFRIITPDMIFDYFEPLFRKESYSSELHKNYILAKTILEKLDASSLAAKIIKTLSLIYILEQFDKIKPTIDELDGMYSLEYTHEEIKNTIDDLIYKEYVVYLKVSNAYLRLKQTSGVDIRQAIADEIERSEGSFSIKETLNSSSLENYMYPSRYNDDREMTRYFSFRFIESKEILDEVNWDVKSETDKADGVVYGIIPDSNEDIEDLVSRVCNSSKGHKRHIFIVPRKYDDIREIVSTYNAVVRLRNAAEGDETLFDEYEVVYEDLRDVIYGFINSYTHPEYYRSIYVHDGEKQSITRKAALSDLMSRICESVYSKTPIINNEAINKHELTGTAYTSRSKIIAGLLRNTLEENLGLTGTGQEVSIMRSTLIRKNILCTDLSGTKICLETGDDRMDHLLSVISECILEAKRKGSFEFKEIYRRLTSPEYSIGLRESLIPIYLAAVLHEYKQEAVIVGSFGQEPLNVDTLLQIEAEPSMFQLQYLDWDPAKEVFIRELEEVFEEYIVPAEKASNSYDYIISAMKRWYMSLPKYSKEKVPDKNNKKHRCLIRLLKQGTGSYEMLFVKLPQEYKLKEVNHTLVEHVKDAKLYYDGVLSELIERMISEVKDIYSSGTGRSSKKRSSLTSVIKDWCEGLNPQVFDQLFENGADRCIGFYREITNDEKAFIIRLAQLATDLRVEDWDEKTIDLFTERLKEFKATAENFTGESDSSESTTSGYSLTYVDDSGNSITKRFDRVEQSKRGKLLMNSLLADIESMGHSISEQEKRQILMEVLKKLC